MTVPATFGPAPAELGEAPPAPAVRRDLGGGVLGDLLARLDDGGLDLAAAAARVHRAEALARQAAGGRKPQVQAGASAIYGTSGGFAGGGFGGAPGGGFPGGGTGGCILGAGETLVAIDPADFRLAVEVQEAALAEARSRRAS